MISNEPIQLRQPKNNCKLGKVRTIPNINKELSSDPRFYYS